MKKRSTALRTVSTVLGGLVTIIGCNSPTETGQSFPPLKSNYVDTTITEHHNLGWLGAKSNPVAEPINLQDPDDPDARVSPGAIVLRELSASGAAPESGLQVGDVIVRVSESWLPIKDDPTHDFLAAVEGEISSGSESIDLGIIRDGQYQTLSIAHTQLSIDDGLPHGVARFDHAAKTAIQRLVSEQNEDGSFGNKDGLESDRLRMTALAGLAMLATGEDSFKEAIEKSLQSIGTVIDTRNSAPEPSSPKTSQPSDVEGATAATQATMIMPMPSIDLDPLTASYVLMFLAESDIQLLDQNWMQRIMGLTGCLTSSQSESGGWNTAPETAESDHPAVDLLGTHTTNQVLTAIGALERKGVMANAETFKRACEFLKRQSEARSMSALDRRTRAALSAGTAAAMVAINCLRSDPFLKQSVDECLERANDVHTAPSLALSGLVSTAVVARGAGNETWIRFHNAAKIWLASAQTTDGVFCDIPGLRQEHVISLEQHSQWKTVHYALTLAMQRGRLKKLTGRATTPMQIARNSAGEKSDGAGTSVQGMPMMGGNMPAGAKMMKFDIGDLSGEGSLEDQIKEKLKEQGVDVDNIQVGQMPGSKKDDVDEDDEQ